MPRHGTHEIFQWIGDIFLQTDLLGWWGSSGGVHLLFHDLNHAFLTTRTGIRKDRLIPMPSHLID